MQKVYKFGAQETEKHPESKKVVRVWKSPKFMESALKATEIIDKGNYGVTEGDFWILKTFGPDYCQYASLIISHNGCLKINDKLADEDKFVPSCVSWVRNVTGDLVLQYLNDKQGLLEFGEASLKNCKNAYPFAMVLKRLQDRVILKNSKIAFFGIMSEAESDEFKEPIRKKGMITDEQMSELLSLGCDLHKVAVAYKLDSINDMTEEMAAEAIKIKRGQ